MKQRESGHHLSKAKRPNAKEQEFLQRVWMGESKKDAYLAVWPNTQEHRANDQAYKVARKSECRSYYENLVATADEEWGLTKPRLLRGYENIFEDETQPMSARISAGQETAKLKGLYEVQKVEAKLGIVALLLDDGERV